MSRIVITSFGSYGDVNPYLGLALATRVRGHDPVLATSPFYRDYVQAEGIAFRPVGPDLNPNDRDLLARVMDANRGTEFLVRDLLMPGLREAYDDLAIAVEGADLLITHPITFAGPILAQERGLRWASTVLSPISFFSPNDLPVVPPVPWLKSIERIPLAAEAFVYLAKSASRPWTKAVNALRAERGLARGEHPIFEGQHSPHLVLALFSKVLGAPQRDWPANVRITGAIPYNGPATSQQLAPEIEDFLKAGPAPIVFTLGSAAVGVAGRFYEESAEAARRLGARAVLLVGSHEANRLAVAPSADVLVVDHAPHASLMPRASVNVHQGGVGTLQQALRAARPMLVVPFAHDQPDNAYRVERLGVARTLSPRRYTAGRAVDELERLLGDVAYTQRASEVGAVVRAEDGATAACDAIEELLRR